MQLVKLIQDRIESLYGIRIGVDVNDFLIDENELSSLLPSNQQTTTSKELFLVNPKPLEDTVEVALFLDPSLKQNLTTHDPTQTLSSHNISDFCSLIEGISHFIYYLHKAELKYDVTELELELQAEIDKFLLLSLLTKTEDVSHHQLLDLLFDNYQLHDFLSDSQEERYVTASGLARKFCFELSKDIKQNNMKELFKKIRQFYPLTQEEKIRTILS